MKAAEPRALPKQHAVLLVHGVLGQEFIYWNLLKRYLRSDQYHFHEVKLPFFGFGDLRKSAAQIARAVDEVLASSAHETDDGKVDIVAHSAGGLAARFYVKFLGGNKRVHALVTLGAPHHGTYTALGFPLATVVRQTLPGSEFLQEINEGDEAPGPVEYTSIYTLTDGVVVPANSAILSGADNIKVRGTTHWGFLWRPKVYKVIREALDHGPRPLSRRLQSERRKQSTRRSH